VAGEVVEIVFLRENVGLRGFFAASKAPEKDWGIDLCGEFGAASGIDAVGFALSALLGSGGRCGTDGNKHGKEEDGEEGTICRAPTRNTPNSRNLA
jgi:hypothetical protein